MNGEQQQAPPSIQYNIIQPSNETFSRWLETMDEEVEKLEHALRGERMVTVDARKGTFRWEKSQKPIMNEQGIQFISSYLHMNLGKGTTMSNLPENEERLYFICYQTVRPLVGLLAAKEAEFDFDVAYLHTVVCGMISNMLEMAYRRAIGGEERKHVVPIEQTHTSRMIDETAQQSSSPFNIFQRKGN